MTSERSGRFRRGKVVACLGTVLSLLATLLFLEHDAGARSIPPTATVEESSEATAPIGFEPPPPLMLPADATESEVLAAAQHYSDEVLGRVEAAIAAATQTAEDPDAIVSYSHVPPEVSAIVCPTLLQERATLIATFNALIAQFPFLAPQLLAILTAALATIDAQIANFHCIAEPSAP